MVNFSGSSFNLRDVLIVPSLSTNIVSVKKFTADSMTDTLLCNRKNHPPPRISFALLCKFLFSLRHRRLLIFKLCSSPWSFCSISFFIAAISLLCSFFLAKLLSVATADSHGHDFKRRIVDNDDLSFRAQSNDYAWEKERKLGFVSEILGVDEVSESVENELAQQESSRECLGSLT